MSSTDRITGLTDLAEALARHNAPLAGFQPSKPADEGIDWAKALQGLTEATTGQVPEAPDHSDLAKALRDLADLVAGPSTPPKATPKVTKSKAAPKGRKAPSTPPKAARKGQLTTVTDAIRRRPRPSKTLLAKAVDQANKRSLRGGAKAPSQTVLSFGRRGWNIPKVQEAGNGDIIVSGITGRYWLA